MYLSKWIFPMKRHTSLYLFVTKYSFGNNCVNWIRKDASCKTLSLKIFINGTGSDTNKFYSPPFENMLWIIAIRAKACSKWKYLSRHLLTPQFGVQLNVKGSANWHPHLVTSIIRQTVIDKCVFEMQIQIIKLQIKVIQNTNTNNIEYKYKWLWSTPCHIHHQANCNWQMWGRGGIWQIQDIHEFSGWLKM